MMLKAVNIHLEVKGIKIATGTIVDTTIIDAAIIHAPSSTKNVSGEHDPEMQPIKKDNQWYFGLKAHIGVDAEEGAAHTVVTTVAHARVLPDLLHGEERKVWGDGGNRGQTEAIKAAALKAQDMTCRRTKFKHSVNELPKKQK